VSMNGGEIVVRALEDEAVPFTFGIPGTHNIELYDALAASRHVRPVLVTEGGWSSASVPGSDSSPEEQAHWIKRQMQLADSARALAVLQIPFTDLDMRAWGGVPEAQTLSLFAHLGLVDVQLRPKPALAVWDTAFQRPRAGP